MAGETVEYDILAALVGYLGTALRCAPDGTPSQVRVNIGSVEDGGCDSLTASVQSVRTMYAGDSLLSLPDVIAPEDRGQRDVGVAIEFTVALARHCWPTEVQRDGAETVTYNASVGEATEAATASLLIDGRVLHAALLGALADPSLWWTPEVGEAPVSLSYAVGPRLPIKDVGCVGWAFSVLIEVGAFCPWEMCEAPDVPDVDPVVYLDDDRTDVPTAGSVDVRPAWMV